MTSLAVRSVLSLLLSLFFSFLCFSTSEVFGEEQREFDYFLLALQWPGTICQRTHHCCPKNGCCQSSLPRTEFTIHGLWVNYNDGSWPACCSRPDFDIKKITSLMGMLEKYWPSLSCSSSSLCHGGKGLFWAHEWEKHGTCSFPVIQDEYCYFSTALNLYFKYNMTPRDCIIGSSTQDDMLGSRSSCPRYISLPEYSPLMLQDGNAAIPWLPDIEAL